MDFSWYDMIPSVGALDAAYQGVKGVYDNAGLPTQYQDRNEIMNGIRGGTGQSAPTIDQSQSNQFRQGQMQQIGQLQGIANGTQQGAGELAAQRQTQNALASQQALARMARGNNAGMAYRQSANNAAGIGLAGAGQAQQAALQDQQSAQGLLANALGQGRNQDYQNAYANQQAIMNQRGLAQGYNQQLIGMDQGQLAAAVAAKQSQNQVMGGLMNQGAGLASSAASMFSDERLKTDVRDGDEDIDALMDALSPKTYRYKDERHGVGERVGIMAQDLEKSAAGRKIVHELPEGKALDMNKAISAALAASARLNERLRKIEG